MAEETAMSEVATQTPAPGAGSKPKPPAPGQETREMIKRAAKGDRSCLPAIEALLADGDRGEFYRETYGSPDEWLRQSIICIAAGKNVVAQDAIRQKLDKVRSELEGPDPTPIERLLSERVSLCWALANWYENSFLSIEIMSILQDDFHQRKIARAHARFLSAVRTLAQVRKLAEPALQLNIAKNQVNVAGAGSRASGKRA
jgi:hypothetical protein